MTDKGFFKAQSDNMPKVYSVMVAEFYSKSDSFSLAEIKGIKAMRAGHESYGDSAVGYVQVRREGALCTIKGRICPEHKVRSKNYNVSMQVDEQNEEVLSVACNDCAASAGGCKHAIAFLMWVHRRSEEPAPTEVSCYWKKSKLASVGTSLKFIRVEDFGQRKRPLLQPRGFLKDVIQGGLERHSNSQILKYFEDDSCDSLKSLGLYQLLQSFIKEGGDKNAENFLQFAEKKLTVKKCEEACKSTQHQSTDKLWHELRYGRITASIIYEVCRCKKISGSLVERIVGNLKVPETLAMLRGKHLEKRVLQVLKEETKIKFNEVGLILSPQYPYLGASPDAISKEFVVEIKCPSNEKSFSLYMKDHQITNKFKGQIQLQMFLFKKKRGIFCVADPSFELNNKIHTLFIDYDQDFVETIIDSAKLFWCNAVFPLLFNSIVDKD